MTLREALARATDSAGRIHSTRALALAIDEADARLADPGKERREDDAGAGWRRYDETHARARLAAQRLISVIGSIGPESVEDAAERAVAAILSKARVIGEVSNELDEARAEMATHRRAAERCILETAEALARAERAEAMLDRMAEESHAFNALLVDTQRRAEAAEAAFAALREAVLAHDEAETALYAAEAVGSPHSVLVFATNAAIAADETKTSALTDTTAAAEAYRARVRAEALREAADIAQDTRAAAPSDTWAACAGAIFIRLRAMADEEGKR